eukprot:9285007-Pyramimonas_sp.AAC.1
MPVKPLGRHSTAGEFNSPPGRIFPPCYQWISGKQEYSPGVVRGRRMPARHTQHCSSASRGGHRKEVYQLYQIYQSGDSRHGSVCAG